MKTWAKTMGWATTIVGCLAMLGGLLAAFIGAAASRDSGLAAAGGLAAGAGMVVSGLLVATFGTGVVCLAELMAQGHPLYGRRPSTTGDPSLRR